MNQAIEILEQTLSYARKNGDRQGEARTLCSLGYTYSGMGEKRLAMELFQQSIELARVVGDSSIEGHSLWGMCMIWMSEDIEPQKTLALGNVALRIFERLGDPTADLARQILAKQQSKINKDQ